MVIENTWLQGLFGDAVVAAYLANDNQLRIMLDIEAAFTNALVATGAVTPQIAAPILDLLENPTIDHSALTSGVKRDGLVVPSLIHQLKTQLPVESHIALHTGMTSQDVIDTAFAVTLKRIFNLYRERLSHLNDALAKLDKAYGANPMMGRTRMQAALPITVADRLAAWRLPLTDHIARLDRLRPNLEILSLGGPVGVRDIDTVAENMAVELGLGLPPKAPHSMRANMGELANWLSLVTGSLGKIGADISLMAQQGVDEIKLRRGGTSSAMAHKTNPIRAELLVTLGRFNATQLSGVHHALIHEQERSGAAWALEWMLLPPMLEATGAALTAAQYLIADIEGMGPAE